MNPSTLMTQSTDNDLPKPPFAAKPLQAEQGSQILKAFLTLFQNLVRNGFRMWQQAGNDGQDLLGQSQRLYAEWKPRVDMGRVAIKGTPRYKKILATAVTIVASYKTLQQKREFISEERYAAQLSEAHRRNAERIYTLCIDLRGGLIKLAQFLSTRQDLLPPEWVEVLSRLQDKVPPIPHDDIAGLIANELGQPMESIFAEFDDNALAAASLAQVHRAKLIDGTPVAVKVQAPGIDEIITIDMSALRMVGWMFKDLLPELDVDTVLGELIRSIEAELDYRDELGHMEMFKTNLARHSGIIVPEPIAAYSGQRMLTMEMIDGERLTEYLDRCVAENRPDDVDRILRTLIDSFCRQIFEYGHFHADPHPGNFMVDRNGQLVMLDFGSVQINPPEITAAYNSLTLAILAQNREQTAGLLKGMGFHTRDGNFDSLIDFADVLMAMFQDTQDLEAIDIDPREQLGQLALIVKENPVVKIPEHFVMLGRVFSSLAGLFFHYEPRLNLFEIIFPYIIMTPRDKATHLS